MWFKKKTKEDGLIIENLNDLDEFKEDVIIVPNKTKEEVKVEEEVVLKATKKLPIEELKEKVSELEEKLVNPKKIEKTKSNVVISLIASISLFGTLSIGYLGFEELNKKNEEINRLNQNLQSLSVVQTNNVDKQVDNNVDKSIKELDLKIVEINKNMETLKNTKVENVVQPLKQEDVDKAINESFKIKEMNEKIVKALQNTDEEKDKKLAEMMKKHEEASMLMTEVVKKQREEIISLNQKISKLESDDKEKYTLTKDDLNKIAMLETRVLKDSDLIDSLNKQVSRLTDEINNKKLNLLTDNRVIEKSVNNVVDRNESKVTDFKKELPIFSVYKILNNGQFYLKNRVNGKLLEQAISEKDVIIDRYEVLSVDYANKTIIFKDHEKGTSLTLVENE